jgi:hypothetical protein
MRFQVICFAACSQQETEGFWVGVLPEPFSKEVENTRLRHAI